MLKSKLLVFVVIFTLNLQVIAQKSRPNIIFIYVDDMGYEALGSYGALNFSTPNLDKMAKEGLRFSRAYTSPYCTPSRVSMHTGLYARSHGYTGILPVHLGTKKFVDFKKMPTYAQQLRGAGYRTVLTGKWQLATLEEHPNHPTQAGYDNWCLWQIWKTNKNSSEGSKTTRYWKPCLNQNGIIRKDVAESYGPDVLVEYILEQMKLAKGANEPFLIMHNEMLPHWPLIPTPDDRKFSPPRKAHFANMVNYMDKLVGRLIHGIEVLGIKENTYVLFMADNGTEENIYTNPEAKKQGHKITTRLTINGPVNGGKSDLLDGGTHVPMIWWGSSDIAQDKVCEDLVDIVDIFPTICDIAKVNIPENLKLDGFSILPQVQGKEGKSHSFAFASITKKDSIFDGKWRLSSDGQLLDARALPLEKKANLNEPEAQAAKVRLTEVFKELNKEIK